MALELACVTPSLILVALAGYTWGGYLVLDHQVRRAANQALAVARSVQDPLARERRAKQVVDHLLSNAAPRQTPELAIESHAGRLTITVIYDASAAPIFAVRGLMALPPPTIVHMASASLDQ